MDSLFQLSVGIKKGKSILIIMGFFYLFLSYLFYPRSSVVSFVPIYRRFVPICEWFVLVCEWFVSICEWFVPICEWFVPICEWFVIILMGYHI